MSNGDGNGVSAAAQDVSWNPALRSEDGAVPSAESADLHLNTKDSIPDVSHNSPEVHNAPVTSNDSGVTTAIDESHSDIPAQDVVEVGNGNVHTESEPSAPLQQTHEPEVSSPRATGDSAGDSAGKRGDGFDWGDDETEPTFDFLGASTTHTQNNETNGLTNSDSAFAEPGVPEQDITPTEVAAQQEEPAVNEQTHAPAGQIMNGETEENENAGWNTSGNGAGDSEDDFFDQLRTQTKPIYMPPESETRYEEGIPLVEDLPETPVSPEAKKNNRLSRMFDADDDEGGDFFSSVQKPSVPQLDPPPVKRKDTSEVLGSMDFSRDEEGSESPAPFLQAPGADNPQSIKKTSSEEDLAARWQAELDDDDLLVDDDLAGDTPAAPQPVPEPVPVNGVQAHSQDTGYASQSSFGESQVQPNPYAPHQPSVSELTRGLPVPTYGQGSASFVPPGYSTQQQPENAGEKAESFVHRSKEGYKSPYDIPVDLTRPRRAVKTPKPVVASPVTAAPPVTSMPPPPLRSSSITSMPPPAATPPPAPPVTTPKNFYEELPPPSRSRPASRGRYTPQPAAVTTGMPSPPVTLPPPMPSSSAPPAPSTDPYASKLQQPERIDPYGSLPVPSAPSAGPGAASRYSPKPPGQLGVKPPPSPRYSPAPPPQSTAPPARNRYASQPANAGPQPPVLPFQPRTSSPLAHHEKNAYRTQASHEVPVVQQESASPPLQRGQTPEHAAYPQPYSGNMPEAGQDHVISAVHPQQMSPSSNRYAPPTYVNEFAGRVEPESQPQPQPPQSRIPSQVPAPTNDIQFAPPRRSITQSPGRQISGPNLSMTTTEPFQRPASVHDPSSPTKSVNPYAAAARTFSQQLQFIPPPDDQQLDPLERWKGAPIISFGFGGGVTTCFPKHIPRYTAGSLAPQMKPSPGEVKVHQFRDILPSAENIVHYPGPLRSKAKKKEVISWLSSKIAEFENSDNSEASRLHPEPQKRREEKVLLWKIVRILVEQDGALEGSPEIQKSIRNVLFPALETSEAEQPYGGDLNASAVYQPEGLSSQADAVDPRTLQKLRTDLIAGEREKAVWNAVDSRLWGHAMLISSTLDRSIWKQVVQEFVRREVRSAGPNSESLAALYEIFAGNLEESIDELVPPSARAGLQMVSKLDGQGPAKNALDGLDSWRDTLGLVLSNRSADDYQALVALGGLLASYGRTEASHICYIFSQALSPIQLFGGLDDPQANVVLLGADHRQFPATFSLDEDAILLTEVYEFATAVLKGAPISVLPHLQAFKVQYAATLAASGRKAEAQQYCDAITATLKASTKPSPYYHQRLFCELDELSTRLRQAPGEAGSSWISKPSMEKVSGSMWAKFNSFVAGDDSETVPNGSPKPGEDIGPFAKVTGTPTVSRSPSVSDLYGSYPVSAPQPVPTTSSRYAPSTQYAPNASPEQYRSRSSLDSQRSPSFGFPFGQRRPSQEPSTPGDPYQGGPYNPYGSPAAFGYQATPPQSSYMPLAPVEEDLASQTYPQQGVSSRQSSMSGGYNPGHNFRQNSFGQPLHSHEAVGYPAATTTYEPPTGGGAYEPPSYEPQSTTAQEEQPESPGEKPKKKSFMDDDDDDDLAARAAALKKAEKERKDREADEAFRKAAEADAKKSAQPGKKGWFGGWFAGRRDSDTSSNGGGPIRAKLGEENSFYYDPNLKKWVNKKDPNSANSAAQATPPPPRGPAPQSRASSSGSGAAPTGPPAPPGGPAFAASMTPPSVAPLRSGSPATPALATPPNALPRSLSYGAANSTPPPPGSGLAPPSRPSTSLSNASSIDDLLGAPQARKGGTAKSKRKGRGYVDVMAK
ncbi:COPII vesicle coat protein Sec16 [Paecilomyces variotii No. 5]|uniref:Protein transport protein sec16 n=1 Tax=Byssochlamys spectabilis (strain No. 5 / NBRC 109023) TaxID=1356009 RepID=V5HQK2_BYSSN|nr:COPII vesicle coat protein Sec16 [Paecilomyces variotii No. 5]